MCPTRMENVACRHGHGDICEYLVSEMVYKGDRELPDNEYMKDYLQFLSNTIFIRIF